jgi:hypothetical protein
MSLPQTLRILLFIVLCSLGFFSQQSQKNGILKLSVIDELSGKLVPARVEVLDKNGKTYVVEDALSIEQPLVLLKKNSIPTPERSSFTLTEAARCLCRQADIA